MIPLSLPDTEMKMSSHEFYCPNCHSRRVYKIKPVAEVKLVYVIPIYHQSESVQVLECQICGNGFDPALLHPSNQFLFKLVQVARAELLTATTPGTLKMKLISEGLKEEFVDRLIGLAQN